MSKRLPPFGKQFCPVPDSGVRVALGSGAWQFAYDHIQPIMVLPHRSAPSDFKWPSDGNPALIYERGECNDRRLDVLASSLLAAGSSSVIALREALIKSGDPRVFYDAEMLYVAA